MKNTISNAPASHAASVTPGAAKLDPRQGVTMGKTHLGSRLKGKTIGLVMAFVLAFAGLCAMPLTASADKGDVPEHSKTAKEKGDGTYTIELTVTGDAETDVETAADVNVLIVYDESSSMTSNNVSTNPNRNRADYAEDVMHDFVENLRGYQNTSDPSNIAVALVGFGPSATTREGWTSDLTSGNNGINRFFDDGVDGTITNSGVNSHGYTGNNGTNWYAALTQANSLLNGLNNVDGKDRSGYPTFVILVTDGAPTAAPGETTINPGGNHQWTDFRVYYRAATTVANSIQSKENVTLFGIYAYGREADLLDELMYYSNNGSHRVVDGYNVDTCNANQHNFGATEATDNYFNASDTAALNAAIESIFQKIVQALGVSSVAISDGTTHQVTTSAEEISELLEVDETSYKYWLQIPIDSNNQFQRIDLVSGDPVTYTVSSDGSTVTWGTDGSQTVNGEIVSEGGKRYLRYQWTEANSLYDKTPPTAALHGSSVDWNLSSVGTLLNDVIYSVTFDVYPSQTTLDIVADIMNDPDSYGDLDSEIQKYITREGKLRTNTTASLSWKDTRFNPAQEGGPVSYTNPDPVENTAVEQMALTKEWENQLDGQQAEPVTLKVTRDGEDTYTLTLGNPEDPEDPDSPRVWTDDIFISIGIMGHDGKPLKGSEGHDFTFTEPADLGYYWELDVPIVHPMLINNTVTMLIKVDAKHPAPTGATTYTFTDYEGVESTYYVGETGTAKLTATNHRRSRLNITKAIDGEDADPEQTFPFTLNVVDSKASEGSAGNLNSDYWVWFSVWNGGYVDAVVSGATKEITDDPEKMIDETGWTGYYYAQSGTNIGVNLKKDDNLRFLNLPTDSTYTITEDTLPVNYSFVKSELTAGTDSTFSGGQTTTGKIEVTESDYTVTYTNKYGLADVEVTKVWVDANNQDGLRKTADEFKSFLLLKADGTDVTNDNADKLTVTVDPDDANKYIVKWTGLDRYASGEEIKYTVEETEIAGYTTTGSPAEDHGIITNTHTPETVNVVVNKVWDDSNNIGKIRPSSINAQLKVGETASGDPVTLQESNQWTYTWQDKPKYENGTAIAYTADETAVPTGYTKQGPVVETSEDGKTITITITNKYTPTPTTASFPVAKELVVPEGLDGPDDASWTVTLTAGEGVPMPTATTGTISEDEGASFGPISYAEPGTYTYTVTESGEVAGVTNDTTAAKTVTVTVTDKGDGTLEATASSTDASPLTFTNTYGVEPTTASFPVAKELVVPEGLDGPDDASWTVTLTAGEGVPMPTATTGTISEDEGASFGPISYAEPGTYTYTVTESGEVAGVTNDTTAAKTVTVTVTDKGDGTLEATASSTDASPLTFTNTYGVEPTTASFPVAKELVVPEGLDGPDDASWTVTLTAGEGVPMPTATTGTISEDEGASFGPISYAEPGTYTYTVTESGEVAGVTNDTTAAKTVTVTVTDKGDGTLEATASSTDASPLTFTNTYGVEPTTASFPVAKELVVPEGLDGPDDASWTVTLTAGEGVPMPTATTGTISEDEGASFGPISYAEPGTYTYTVTESGEVAGVTNDTTAAKTVTVTVTDKGDGTLEATASSTDASPLTFTNTYGVEPTTASFPVAKELVVPEGLDGPDDASWTVTLTAGEGVPMPTATTGTISEDEGASFGPISYAEPGTYTYTVTESGEVAGVTNDTTAAKTVTVTVTDKGDGTLEATASSTDASPLTFTNTYGVEPTTASFPVAKELVVPEGLDGPDDASWTVTLTAGEGVPMPTATTGTISEDEGASFGPISYAEPGTYTYTVTESGEVAGVTNDTTAAKTVTVTVTDKGDGTLEATASSTDASPLTFTNTYGVEPTTASFPVAKELVVPEGLDGPDDASWTVTLTAGEGVPMPTATTGTISEDEGASFGPISYAEPGTYTYTVTESGEVAGVTNDTTAAKTVTVTVTDKGDGTLEATASSTDASPLTFTNTYGVEPTTASFPVAKELVVPEGLDGPDDASWTVTLTAGEGVPMPTATTGTISEDEGASFGPISYAEPGTYTYTVTESGEVAGVTNDTTAAKTVTVTVTDKGDGTLEATASSTDASPLTFTNTYGVEPTTASFPVAKELVVPEGLDGPDDASWTVTLTAGEGVPMPTATTGTISEDEGASFGPISYAEPGTYTYTVTESGEVAGVTNDTTAAKTVTVTVTDKGDGTLEATASSTDASPLTFTNTYGVEPTTASFPVAKELVVPEGLDGPDDASWTVTLTAGEGVPMPTATTGTISEDEGASFGPISYAEPGTYTYTVTESGEVAGVTNDTTAAKTVTVTVTDKGDGTLEATASSTDASPLTFTNTYGVEPTTASFPVAKELVVPEGLDGPDDASWTVTLTAGEGVPMPTATTGTISEDEGASFGPISYAEPGTYTYTVTESGEVAGVTNDTTAAKTVTVTVTDKGDGTLEATASSTDASPLTFTNTYGVEPTTASFPVAKELVVPEGLDGPDDASWTVTLTAGEGVPMPTATTGTISEDEGASFGPISYAEPGTYTYTVTESGEVAGVTNDTTAAKTVTVTVTDKGDGTLEATASSTDASPLTFTNTYGVEEEKFELFAGKELTVESPAYNAPDVSEKYTLTLTASGDPVAPMPEGATDNKVEIKNADGNSTMRSFGEIAYTAPGQYQYTVTESGTVPGVTNGQESYTVVVDVTDNGDGTMSATINAEKSTGAQETLFTNTYKVTPATAEAFEVTKKLTGTPLAAAAFKFEVKSVSAPEGVTAPMPDPTTVTNDASGKVAFAAIEYTKPGTYTYAITEQNGGVGGYTYDDGTVDVTVEVTDNGQGELVAEVSYGDKKSFVNTYKASGDVTLFVKKELDSFRTLEEDQFTFELLDETGEVIQTAKNDAEGQVQFAPIKYDQTIFPEEATVEEATPEVKSAEKKAAIDETEIEGDEVDASTTADEADEGAVGEVDETDEIEAAEIEDETEPAIGEVDAGDDAAEPEPEPESEPALESVQIVDPDPEPSAVPSIFKVVETAEAAEPEIEPVNDTPDSVVVTNDAPVTADAEAVEGEETNVDEAPVLRAEGEGEGDDEGDDEGEEAGEARSKTFTYTIREVDGGQPGYTYDGHEVTVTVTVTDDGEGNLEAEAKYEGATTFVNTYEAEGSAKIEGSKTVTGTELAEGQFSFELKKGNDVVETVTNAADGSFEFAEIVYDEPGTYEYTIVEVNDGQTGYTYDAGICEVAVEVTDNGNGTLSTEVTYGGDGNEFTNPYDPLDTSAPFKAAKKLEGRDLKAGEFSFELVDADGKVVKTATNAADGSVDFGYVTFDKVGNFAYTAFEVKGSDSTITYDASQYTYKVEVVDDGGQLKATVTCDAGDVPTFKNKYTPEEPPVIPITGDSLPVVALVVVAMAAAGTGIVAVRRRSAAVEAESANRK